MNNSDQIDRIRSRLRILLRNSARRGASIIWTRCWQHFPAFLMKVFETVSPGDEFQSNWHIDAMTYAAECVIDGKIKRLSRPYRPATSNRLSFR